MKWHRERARRVAELARRGIARPKFGDGCSFSPDGFVVGNGAGAKYISLLPCCEEHDEKYAEGGTEEERQAADSALKLCIYCRLRGYALAMFRSRYYHRAVRVLGRFFWPYRS